MDYSDNIVADDDDYDDFFRGVGMSVVPFPNDRFVHSICITKIMRGLVRRQLLGLMSEAYFLFVDDMKKNDGAIFSLVRRCYSKWNSIMEREVMAISLFWWSSQMTQCDETMMRASGL